MERDIRLPKRKKNERLDLTELQMTFLDCYMLQIMEPGTLFRALISPSKTVRESNAMMKSLLRNSDAVSYMRDRKEQLVEYYFGEYKDEEEIPQRSEEDIRNLIYKKISEDIVESIENKTLDYKQGDILTKFMNKALDYDEKEVNAPEPPKVYLPESCSSCRYRIAIEETDETIDECLHCRYRQDDLDRGIVYNYKTQLNIK